MPATDTDAKAAELMRIMNAGVSYAQEQNRQRGIPNVYSINGIIYYELPDGSLSREDPWQGKDTPPAADRAEGNASK
jgi:hypothetical protein